MWVADYSDKSGEDLSLALLTVCKTFWVGMLVMGHKSSNPNIRILHGQSHF